MRRAVLARRLNDNLLSPVAISPAHARRNSRRRERVRRWFFDHDLQVSSFGGAGTTLLCSWLGRQRHLATPRITGEDWEPWKHMRTPPPDSPRRPDFRAVYVTSDPRDAVASVFRRNFQHGHVQRLEGDVGSWDFGWDLAGYLSQEGDLYRLSEHVDNWLGSHREYPILVLRYESLWDNLDALQRFVGLPDDTMATFPPRVPRSTDWRAEPAPIREGLDRMYGPLAARLEQLPGAFVVQKGERRAA